MKDDRQPDITLVIKCALEAGAKIIKNDAGLLAGIYVNGKLIDVQDILSFNNCQDTKS